MNVIGGMRDACACLRACAVRVLCFLGLETLF